jgi:transcriptional regulator with XRE-family HTH domain
VDSSDEGADGGAMIARTDPESLDQSSERTFGDLIRRHRRAAGLSQKELAEQAGIDPTYLSKIENSVLVPPSVRVVARLAIALDTNPIELLAARRPMPAALQTLTEEQWAAVIEWLSVRWDE